MTLGWNVRKLWVFGVTVWTQVSSKQQKQFPGRKESTASTWTAMLCGALSLLFMQHLALVIWRFSNTRVWLLKAIEVIFCHECVGLLGNNKGLKVGQLWLNATGLFCPSTFSRKRPNQISLLWVQQSFLKNWYSLKGLRCPPLLQSSSWHMMTAVRMLGCKIVFFVFQGCLSGLQVFYWTHLWGRLSRLENLLLWLWEEMLL